MNWIIIGTSVYNWDHIERITSDAKIVEVHTSEGSYEEEFDSEQAAVDEYKRILEELYRKTLSAAFK